jgi:hypothetical protein
MVSKGRVGDFVVPRGQRKKSAAADLMILIPQIFPIPVTAHREKWQANALQVERHAFDRGVGMPSGLLQMIFGRFAEVP